MIFLTTTRKIGSIQLNLMGHTQTLKRVIKLLTFWFKPRRKPKLVINCEHTIKHTTWE